MIWIKASSTKILQKKGERVGGVAGYVVISLQFVVLSSAFWWKVEFSESLVHVVKSF